MTEAAEERVLTLYEEDKALGRRLANGAKPIKKLNVRHRQLIALFLEGYSNNDVALILKMTPSRTSILRNDPLIAAVVNRHIEDADAQLAALFPKAVQKVSDGLDSPDPAVYLRASDQLFKTQAKFKEAATTGPQVTAEDVARQVIKVKGEAEITIEKGTRLSVDASGPMVKDAPANKDSIEEK